MAIHDNSHDTRTVFEKQNADGTTEVYALAHGALTAKTPYVVYPNYDGFCTLALFDTTLASTTAAGSYGFYKIGVPNVAVSSGVGGWLQVGGYCADVVTPTLTCTASCLFRWVDAAVARGNPLTSVSSTPIDGFAVGIVAASATQVHTMFLLNRYVIGTT